MNDITPEQCALLLKVLEVRPIIRSISPKTGEPNLKLRHFSFYSSELKNLKQILAYLLVAADEGWVSFSTESSTTKVRYANTLKNLALLVEEGENLVLSATAKRLVEYATDRGLTPINLVSLDYAQHAIEFEAIILDNLLSILNTSSDTDSRVYKFSLRIFYNLQEFCEACKHLAIEDIVGDLDLLYFCQAINSSGFELKKFFSLAKPDRDELTTLWKQTADSKLNFKNVDTNPFEKAVYAYIPRNLQKDVRSRCRNLIGAYLLLKEKYNIPEIVSDTTILRKISMRHNSNLAALTERGEIKLPHQLIVTGCPGSGKSTYLDAAISEMDENAQVARISAHPEYSYSDLIGCYKPVPIYQRAVDVFTSSGERFEKGLPRINYEFVTGPLVRQLMLAIQNPSYNFVLIIEEINRTNCNSLFGDFFQLLDRKEGESEFEIEAAPDLAAVLIEHGLTAKIKLPPNLYIWATMNAADQGVFSLDSAFRRRWEFIYKGYEEECKYPIENKCILYGGKNYDWDKFRSKINIKLSGLEIHEDKMIGPYFLKMDEMNDSDKVCNKLFLYLWEDVLRFQRSELTDYKSFSSLVKGWNEGSGSPLNIELDVHDLLL